MKKLLILFGVLTSSVIGFANNEISAEEKLEITARIVQPLDLQVEPVRFGDVVIGEQSVTPVRDGLITIVGEPSSNVKVEMRYKETMIDITSNGEEIEILNENNPEVPALVYKPEFVYEETKTPVSSNRISLPNGTASINARGSLTAPENPVVGDYSGEIDVKVYYD